MITFVKSTTESPDRLPSTKPLTSDIKDKQEPQAAAQKTSATAIAVMSPRLETFPPPPRKNLSSQFSYLKLDLLRDCGRTS